MCLWGRHTRHHYCLKRNKKTRIVVQAVTLNCSRNDLAAAGGLGFVSHRRTAADQQPDKSVVGSARGTGRICAFPAHPDYHCNHLQQTAQQRPTPTDTTSDTPAIVHNLSLKKTVPGLASSSGRSTLEVVRRLGVETITGSASREI